MVKIKRTDNNNGQNKKDKTLTMVKIKRTDNNNGHQKKDRQ